MEEIGNPDYLPFETYLRVLEDIYQKCAKPFIEKGLQWNDGVSLSKAAESMQIICHLIHRRRGEYLCGWWGVTSVLAAKSLTSALREQNRERIPRHQEDFEKYSKWVRDGLSEKVKQD